MLTNAQLPALKQAIDADPVLTALPKNDDTAIQIAAAFNLVADPDFWVWRTLVLQDEIMLNGFDWTRVDNLSVGKARVWEWMFNNAQRSINPSKVNIRSGIIAVWTGTAQDLAVREVVFGHCQRLALRGERIYATGAGTSQVNGAGPGTLGFEGLITASDVSRARDL